MELNVSPRQGFFAGRQPIVVARLAAAAFALGMGVAFAGASAVAYADSPDSSESSASHVKTGKSASDNDSSSDSTPSDTDGAAGDSASEEDEAAADDSAAEASTRGTRKSDRADAGEADDDVADETDDAELAAEEDSAPEEPASPEAPSVPAAEEDSADVTTTAVEDDSPAPATAVIELAEEPKSWDIVVDDFAAQLARLFGFMPEGLTGENEPPPLRTVLEQSFAALRRTFLSGLPNEAPTARPDQVYQFLSGEVIGDLRAFDINGNPLKYTVTQDGAHGQVTVNANGTFIYAPSSALARTGGIDSFVVTIDDGTPLAPGSTATGIRVVPVTVRITPTLGATRGFHIANFDTQDVTITAVTGDSGEYHGQPVGFVIKQGSTFYFEVEEWKSRFRTVYLQLTSKTGQVYTVTADVPHYWDSTKPGMACNTTGGCTPGSSIQRTQHTTLMGPKDATTVVLDANNTDEAQRIATALKAYCNDSSVFSCSFETIKDEKTIGGEHVIGKPVYNTTDQKQSTDFTESDTVSESDSVKVGIKLSGGVLTKLASLINIEITTEYQHTWTRTHTFQQVIKVTIDPHSVGYVYVTEPIYRTWGNFKVKVGNTTYDLRNIYFDSPRTDGLKPYGGYVIKQEPWTGAPPAGAIVLGPQAE